MGLDVTRTGALVVPLDQARRKPLGLAPVPDGDATYEDDDDDTLEHGPMVDIDTLGPGERTRPPI